MVAASTRVKVWDLFVRVFHWGLLVAFVVAYFTAEEGGEVHEISGYVVLALISARVIWGFIGSKHARFSDFMYSPATVIGYAREHLGGNPKRYLGHNPLGGYMVIALLVMLFAVTLSGLKLESIKESEQETLKGKASLLIGSVINDKKMMESDEEKAWEEIHETLTNIMLVLIVLHIAGVIISGRLHNENLARAMVTGDKDANKSNLDK